MLFTETGLVQLWIHPLLVWFSVSVWRHFSTLTQTTHGCFLGLLQDSCVSWGRTSGPIFRKSLGKGIDIRNFLKESWALGYFSCGFLGFPEILPYPPRRCFPQHSVCTSDRYKSTNYVCKGVAWLQSETTIRFHSSVFCAHFMAVSLTVVFAIEFCIHSGSFWSSYFHCIHKEHFKPEQIRNPLNVMLKQQSIPQ